MGGHEEAEGRWWCGMGGLGEEEGGETAVGM